MLGKIFNRRQSEKFFLFFQKTGFDISCKLSPEGKIGMKFQTLFYGDKKEKNIVSLLSADIAQIMVKVKLITMTYHACGSLFFYSGLNRFTA